MNTIARVYDSYGQASQVVADLEAAGCASSDINIIANRYVCEESVRAQDPSGAGAGAGVGAALGGTAGLLAGLGVIAIPGLGPVVAAGWLVATLAGAGFGAATGGLIGGLVGAGLGEEHAQAYAEGVRRGGSLVTVRAEEGRITEAEEILESHRPVDIEHRAGEYRAAGWTGAEGNAAATPTPALGAATGLGTTTLASATGTRTHTDPMTGTPDGMPGNPPGTAASRGMDDTLGTNASGARPENEARRDGTPGNPPGTAASRALDDTLGSNVSGARPENESRRDGTPGNPPGTAASRGVDDALGTNVSGARPENERPRR